MTLSPEQQNEGLGPHLSLALDVLDAYVAEHVAAVSDIPSAAERYGVLSANGQRIMALRELRYRIVRAGIRHHEQQSESGR